MAITVNAQGDRLYVHGDTYPLRDRLKVLGCKWAPAEKAWYIEASDSARAVLEALVVPSSSSGQLIDLPGNTYPVRDRLRALGGRFIDLPGNTYPVRDRLRALGGRFDAERKVWQVPSERLEEAQVIVAAAPREAYRPSRCKQCGARPGPRGWPRIYRNGICSDCYEFEED